MSNIVSMDKPYGRLKIDRIEGKWAYCTCSCGKATKKRIYHLRDGLIQSCGCLRNETTRKTFFKGVGQLSMGRWSRILRDAATRDLKVEVTIDEAWALFLSQGGRCALSGLPITLSSVPPHGSASLDRIDSRFAYVSGNVWWVHKDINIMKASHALQDFIDMCRAVARHQEQKDDRKEVV
jgi:hypothetical protein